MDIQARTAANRRLLADFFGLGGFLLQVVRARGSINRASEAVARELARRPLSELTALLRDRSDQHGKAPGVGPMGQMADGCVHLRDCARPLGLPDDVRIDDWLMVLDWLPSGVPGLVPTRRLDGLWLVTTDQEWSWGDGEEITGPSEALAMAVSGRALALNDLGGPGVDPLRQRLSDRG